MLKEILKELIIVVLGVFIALLINNIIQEKKNQSFVENSIELIKIEQNENLEHLQKTIESQEKFIMILKEELNNNELTFGEIVQKAKGFSIPSVSTTAWDKLLSNHLELVDYDYIKALNRIEKRVIFLEDIKSRLGEIAYEKANNKDSESKSLILTLIQDLIRSEIILVEDYKDFNKMKKNTKHNK